MHTERDEERRRGRKDRAKRKDREMVHDYDKHTLRVFVLGNKTFSYQRLSESVCVCVCLDLLLDDSTIIT